MFGKLRNRFLILNLVIISVMMIFSFVSIYLMTYRDVRTRIDMELRIIQGSYFGRNIPQRPADSGNPGFVRGNGFKPSRENSAVTDNENVVNTGSGNVVKPDGGNGFKPPRERSVSFSMEADSRWNIVNKSSSFEVSDELYEKAKNEAVSQNRDRGDFNLDGEHWTFIINQDTDGYRLIFLDTTSQQGILTNLIYTFLIVALVTFVFIYFISRFFANRSIKPVKEAFERQKEFIADASHELKTPLAVINTNVDALLSNGEDTINNQIKWLSYIKSQTERMAKLTNDLLYLAKMDHSEVETAYSKFNLSEAAENVILTMEAVIYEHNITLDYEIEPKLTAYGNDEQVRQVIMILLDNAVKYTNKNGSIAVKLSKQNNELVLSVKNTGEGIAEEHLKKIFDRFYRIDKSRSTKLGGHGLGLSIAKAIIDQHKGRIYAESKPNESTTFTVKLPMV